MTESLFNLLLEDFVGVMHRCQISERSKCAVPCCSECHNLCMPMGWSLVTVLSGYCSNSSVLFI